MSVQRYYDSRSWNLPDTSPFGNGSAESGRVRSANRDSRGSDTRTERCMRWKAHARAPSVVCDSPARGLIRGSAGRALSDTASETEPSQCRDPSGGQGRRPMLTWRLDHLRRRRFAERLSPIVANRSGGTGRYGLEVKTTSPPPALGATRRRTASWWRLSPLGPRGGPLRGRVASQGRRPGSAARTAAKTRWARRNPAIS